MDDLDIKALESGGSFQESFYIHLINKKQGLSDGSDSEHDSEANFEHEGCKRHEIVTPTNI